MNGVIEASQGFPFHVVECACVCNSEVGVGSGSDGVGNVDSVILFEASYSVLANKDFGKDEEEFLQA